MIDLILLSLLAGNPIAFGLFWFDKAQARNGGRRLSERSLLLAVAYGGLGALMGQHILRHKTRKQPFATWLGLIFSLYVLVLLSTAAVFIWKLRFA